VLFIIPLPFAYYLVQILLIEFQIQKTVVASFSPSVFVFKNEQRQKSTVTKLLLRVVG